MKASKLRSVRLGVTHGSAVSVLALASAALGGCTGEVTGKDPIKNPGTSGGSSGMSGGSTSVGPQDCTGDEIAMPKRLIRLSFNQIASSLRPVFGDAFAADVLKVNQIPPTTQRTFPPLGDTSEGTTYIDAKWQSSEAIAAKAADHVFANFGSMTGCAEPATADCGRAFLLEHAEGA